MKGSQNNCNKLTWCTYKLVTFTKNYCISKLMSWFNFYLLSLWVCLWYTNMFSNLCKYYYNATVWLRFSRETTFLISQSIYYLFVCLILLLSLSLVDSLKIWLTFVFSPWCCLELLAYSHLYIWNTKCILFRVIWLLLCIIH